MSKNEIHQVTEQATRETTPIWNIFITFLKLGLTSFGGPVAHIGYFHKEFVERKRWLDENTFSQLLAISQFIPGPASSQLGFAIGLLRSGWLGAITAFTAFTLPSTLILVFFASSLSLLSGDIFVAAIHGLKIVACAVVADAVLGMSKKLCTDMQRRTITIVTLCALLLFDMPWLQVLLIIFGALAGLVLCKNITPSNNSQLNIGYGKTTGGIVFMVFLVIFAMLLFPPIQSNLLTLAETFYRSGSLVFGGGHVVLPLLEDSVVTAKMVTDADFLAGYGASQAIPGPMFAFAAYLGALIPTGFNSWIGAAIALLFMFLPGFLLLTAALPFWQTIAHKAKMASAIAGINATVVGMLAAALYDPIFTSSIHSNSDLAIAVVAFSMLTIWKLSPLWVVLITVSSSVLLSMTI